MQETVLPDIFERILWPSYGTGQAIIFFVYCYVVNIFLLPHLLKQIGSQC